MRHHLGRSLFGPRHLSVLVACAALAGCPASEPGEIELPAGLDLGGLPPAARATLRATIAVSDGALGETEVPLHVERNTVSGTFTLQNAERAGARTLTLRVYGAANGDTEEVLLGRASTSFDLAPGEPSYIAFGGDARFETCDAGDDGVCAIVLDANRNARPNIDDLHDGIDPAPQPLKLELSPSTLQFPSGIALGEFARQVVILENLGDNPVRLDRIEVIDAPGVALSLFSLSGDSISAPQRRLRGEEVAIEIGASGEVLIVVSFAPTNGFLSTGAVQAVLTDVVTGVRQGVRTKVIANADGALRPVDASLPLPADAALTSEAASLDALAFPAAPLFSGLAVTATDPDAQTSGLAFGDGASVTLALGEDTARSFAADAAFLVDVPPDYRFSTAVGGLRSDVDLAVVRVEDGALGALACESARDCLSDNAGPSDEAVELVNTSGATLQVAVLLSRLEAARPARAIAGALTDEGERVPFELVARLHKGPEFADAAPLDPLHGPVEGGNLVTLRGRGFQEGARVTFSGAVATNVSYDVADPNQTTITCQAPLGSLDLDRNPATVVVLNPSPDSGGDGQAATLPAIYVFDPPSPRLEEVLPAFARADAPDQVVTVRGLFFSSTFGPPVVTFGATRVDAIAVDLLAGALTVLPPPSDTPNVSSTVSLRVQNRIAPDEDTDADGLPDAPVLGLSSSPLVFSYVVPDGPAPTIEEVNPTSLSVDGGESVTLFGRDFRAGAVVRLGAVLVSDVTLGVDPGDATRSTATFLSPPGADAAVVDVTLFNSDAQSDTLTQACTYFTPDPSITSVSPPRASADGGALLIVSGAGFRPGASLELVRGGERVPAEGVSVASASSMLAFTPPVDADTWQLTVTNPSGESASVPFEVFVPTGPAPAIASLVPAFGSELGGTAVRALVTDADALATLSIAGAAVPTTFVPEGSDGLPAGMAAFDFFTPPSATGAGVAYVQLVNEDGQTSAAPFSYVAEPAQPAPEIDFVSPYFLEVDDGDVLITIAGQNLTGAQLFIARQLVLDPIPADGVQVIVNGEALGVGAHPVEVLRADGALDRALLTVFAPGGVLPTEPVIHDVSPRNFVDLNQLETFTVAGQNLANTVLVQIDNIDLTNIIATDDIVTAELDLQAVFIAPGLHVLHVQTSTGADDYEVFTVSDGGGTGGSLAPVIAGLNPPFVTSGTGIVNVTVFGQNLGASFIEIDGQPTAPLFDPPPTDAELTLSVDTTFLDAGAHIIAVTNQLDPSASDFAVLTVGAAAEPRISFMQPSSAFIGDGLLTVNVNGSGLLDAVITLDGQLASVLSAPFDTLVQIEIDMDAITPGLHVVEATVGADSDFSIFTADTNPPPQIGAVQPSFVTSGFVSSLVVNGSGFLGVESITLDGVPVDLFAVSPNQITLDVTAGGPPGPAQLQVHSFDGQTATFVIERRDPPSLSGLSTNRVHTNGGDIVTVFGQNLDAYVLGPMLQIAGGPFDQNLGPMPGTLTSTSFDIFVLAGLDPGSHTTMLIPGGPFSNVNGAPVDAVDPSLFGGSFIENGVNVELRFMGEGLAGQFGVGGVSVGAAQLNCPLPQLIGDEVRCTMSRDQLEWGRVMSVEIDAGGVLVNGGIELPPRRIASFDNGFSATPPALPALVDLAQQALFRHRVNVDVTGFSAQNLSIGALLVVGGAGAPPGVLVSVGPTEVVFNFPSGFMPEGSFAATIEDNGATVADAAVSFDAVAPDIVNAPASLTWTDTAGSASIELSNTDFANVVAVDEKGGRVVDVTSVSQNGNLGVEIDVRDLAVARWRLCLQSPGGGSAFSCAATPTAVVAPATELESNNTDSEATAIGLIPGQNASGLVAGDLATDARDRFFVLAQAGSFLRVNVQGQSGADCTSGSGASLTVRRRGSGIVLGTFDTGVGSSTCPQVGLDEPFALFDDGEVVLELARVNGSAPDYRIVASVAPPSEPTCGNGVTLGGEDADCEDGTAPLCPFASTPTTCGSRNCLPDFGGCAVQSTGTCGNGVVESGEQCDGLDFSPTAGVQPGACNNFFGAAEGVVRCLTNCFVDGALCMAGGDCGNGIVEGNEQCDDGNAGANDGCTPECLISQCGDRRVQPGEACDDGNLTNGDGCNDRCSGA